MRDNHLVALSNLGFKNFIWFFSQISSNISIFYGDSLKNLVIYLIFFNKLVNLTSWTQLIDLKRLCNEWHQQGRWNLFRIFLMAFFKLLPISVVKNTLSKLVISYSFNISLITTSVASAVWLPYTSLTSNKTF